MANPNKTAGRFLKPGAEVRAARREAFCQTDMAQDMARFQRGEMSADEFRQKWEPKSA